MGIKNKVISLLSAMLMVSTMNISTYAQNDESNVSFTISNSPSGAVYSVYQDVNKNYIYDDFMDTLVTSFECDEYGNGSVSGLEIGDYVVVLESEDTDSNVTYNKEYAFYYNGVNCETQEAFYTQDRLSFDNNVLTDDVDTINIQYDVPLFKQSGPLATEWSSLRVNNSSDTMGYVGCLICSFAMMRSYETGNYIYPNEMMKSYSSSTNVGVTFSANYNCAMNVPASASNYNWTVYGSTQWYGGNGEIGVNQLGNSNLYEVLYNRLQKAPVIFGGYSTPNKRGSTNHWIVVTGYHGDGVNFSAEDFSICDPANNNGYNRTTLAEYNQKYPYWDRLIYNENLQVNMGDVNLDGSVTSLDLLGLKQYILGVGDDLMGLSLQTADMNTNNRVDPIDLIILKKLFLYE